MATRLELLNRCVTMAANDIAKEKGLDGWTITTRSGERCLSIEFYHEASEDEWTCTFPTAGWGGTIDEIKERFREEVAPNR